MNVSDHALWRASRGVIGGEHAPRPIGPGPIGPPRMGPVGATGMGGWAHTVAVSRPVARAPTRQWNFPRTRRISISLKRVSICVQARGDDRTRSVGVPVRSDHPLALALEVLHDVQRVELP